MAASTRHSLDSGKTWKTKAPITAQSALGLFRVASSSCCSSACLRQDTCKIDRADLRVLFPQNAVEVQQAARVGGSNVLGARRFSIARFCVPHRAGDHRKFRGERAAETAAILAIGHFH